MKVSDFHFDLPDGLIASHPTVDRTGSRLLCLDKSSGDVKDSQFVDFINLLEHGDLVIMNNTKVIPARLFGQKDTGGRLEILVERLVSDTQCLAHVRCSRSPKIGQLITLDAQTKRLLEGGGAYTLDGDPSDALLSGSSLHSSYQLEVLGREGALFKLAAKNDQSMWRILEAVGHIPLPPYIERVDQANDIERYQTVYAQHPGAVAAPTAGLHFDDALLDAMRRKGIDIDFVTLHVGAGTFQPVKVDSIEDHSMHSEYAEVSTALCEKIIDTKRRGGRVIAVGTTSVRSLESAALNAGPDTVIEPFNGDTQIFIYPGFGFKVIDALVTNFHLPQSTLIMLVSALAGREQTLAAYQYAIDKKYRFYSYGDAMFIA